MLVKKEPIIAQATAVGKAGIGVVRISGEDLSPLFLFSVKIISNAIICLSLFQKPLNFMVFFRIN